MTNGSKGRKTSSINFSGRLKTIRQHDTRGRLRQLQETGDEEVTHTTSFDYDPYDRLIHTTDPFQNGTDYSYDPFVGKISKTNFPPIASIDGEASSVITSSAYDSLGGILADTDANGNTIYYRYNAYGSPVEILYPQGGKETFLYAKNGDLVLHTDLDGLTTKYQRDILGNILSKTYLSKDDELLAQETFAYNGRLLMHKSDKEGHTTFYLYDGAGRKTAEKCEGRRKEFSYDSLGGLYSITEHNGQNTLFTHYIRDLENRVLEEYKTDSAGTILQKKAYSYDGDGNQKTLTRFIHGKEAVQTFVRDAFGRSTQYLDAEVNLTTN